MELNADISDHEGEQERGGNGDFGGYYMLVLPEMIC